MKELLIVAMPKSRRSGIRLMFACCLIWAIKDVFGPLRKRLPEEAIQGLDWTGH